MGRKMILITCLFASGRCLFSYKERDLVPLCDVSQHQEEYMGKSIAVQGVLILLNMERFYMRIRTAAHLIWRLSE